MSFESSAYRVSDHVPGEERPLAPGDAHPLADIHQNYRRLLVLTNGRYDPVYAGWQLFPMLADQARLAAEQEAISYRDFHVGAAAYALDQENYRAGIIFGANIKPDKSAPKRCAELMLVQKAETLGYKSIPYLVVSGPLQTDEHSGIISPTLHPCADCRDLFLASPLIEDETVLVTVGEDGETHEMFSVAELLGLHAS